MANSLKIGIVFLVLALVTACRAETPRTSLSFTSPLASPLPVSGAEPPSTQGALPTPSTSDMGTVGGVALRQTAEQISPLNGGVLFLAEVQYYEGKPVMGVLDQSTAPQATVDAQGVFVFTNVPSGNYVLVYVTPVGSIVLKNPQTGADMIIEVKGGTVINLGELKYDIGL
ncbi:MAG: hypothetical protein ACUVR4_02025 [Anaerolineae bacterium]